MTEQNREVRRPAPDLAAQAHELVERTCREQGIPIVVTDDRVLDKVAAIVRSAKEHPQQSK